ncbi:MAG TPA: PrsW family glutamic-type intramembrane protease [Roseiflexaceae bacterium]|nr:PrsW family glutamic-type intramembrane protease [Roseiflexaceae bacterium]
MSQPQECCICHERLEPPYHTLGGRVYCARHFAMVNKPHAGLWRADLFLILGMGLFSALVAFLTRDVRGLDQGTLVAAGLLLALVPTALWLFFFYRQDRLEPEPKHHIMAVLLLALLLTQAVGLPLIRDGFRLAQWASADSTTSLLASVLILGFVYQGIAYTAVRAVVYTTAEFDERMDGIVYGTVAGLGVATLLNLRFVLDNGGVALSPGVIRVVTTALAQAVFSGLLGYFMAEAKFERRPFWWVPFGLILAASLNGLFSWLINEVSAAGLQVDPWRSLALGLVVALGVFILLMALMRRVTQVTLAQTPHG